MTEQSALTNETPHSTYDITGLLMPARAFFLLLLMSQVKMASWLGKYMLLILILTFQKQDCGGNTQRRRAADPLKHAHTDKHFGCIRQRATQ